MFQNAHRTFTASGFYLNISRMRSVSFIFHCGDLLNLTKAIFCYFFFHTVNDYVFVNTHTHLFFGGYARAREQHFDVCLGVTILTSSEESVEKKNHKQI